MVLLFVMVVAPALFAKSPVGDWQAVQQDIPKGWQITVVTSMTFPCVFERASEQELVCRQRDSARAEDEEIRIRRERIHEVRVEKRQGANMLAGGAAGAGLGSVLGVLLVPRAPGVSAFALGLGGGSLGARHGRDVHILKGKVIYRRP